MQVATRMGNAKAEINSLNEKGLYDYLVINDSVDEVRSSRNTGEGLNCPILPQPPTLTHTPTPTTHTFVASVVNAA